MRGTGFRALPLAAIALCLTLSGCPLFQSPQLDVSPKALTYGESSNSQYINIQNLGNGALTWSVDEVSRVDENAPWTPQSLAYLSEDLTFGSTQKEIDRVTINVERAGLPVGTYNNIGVRVTSNGGTTVVPLAFIVKPTLIANPSLFTLVKGDTSADFAITNSGTGTANWEILYLPNPNNLNSAVALSSTDITATENPGATAAGNKTDVTISWSVDRTDDFYLLLRSLAGSTVLSIKFGGELEGLQITPSPLTLFIPSEDPPAGQEPAEPTPSKLKILNRTAISRSWTIEARSALNPEVSPPISVSPASGSTAPSDTTLIDVAVTDASLVEIGSGNYDLLVKSGDGFFVVPIVVEKQDLPIIAISEPPNPDASRPEITPLTTLDYERDKVELEFWVANIGPRNSRLYFQIDHSDLGTAHPLIADVTPLKGDANQPDNDFFYPPGSNTLIDGTPVKVTIDRTALVEDVEYRDIHVVAYDADFNAAIDAVDVATVKVRVERQPLTIEGALNRARPPFVNRFVFLLRDSVSQAIPTQTQEQLNKVSFTIAENDVFLDLNETNSYVTGPENLRVNLVLMLDYTGSMFNAGTDNQETPLAQGEAIQQVRNAALRFLDDLPPSYRVALMYHADRQQPSRLIANFTTDRDALKRALTRFNVPDTLHGTSDIRDALMDAMTRLESEDAGTTIPFDDADLRAVLFVTDGRDTSSVAQSGDVKTKAENTRTRLYPLIYASGSQIDASDMITFAHDSGGHMYNGGEVTNLARLLGNAKSLTFDPVTPAFANTIASFTLSNTGASPFQWSVPANLGIPWITSVSRSGSASDEVAPGASQQINITIDPTKIGANTTLAGEFPVTTTNDSGAGKVQVIASVGADPTKLDSVKLLLEDEPGVVWGDLRNQIVLTYVTPLQHDGIYNVTARWEQPQGGTIAGSFERNGVFFPGDVRAGQISMTTDGIIEDFFETDPARQVRAEAYVRCDYAPRDVNRFRLRFFFVVPDGLTPAQEAALNLAQIKVELAPGGLVSGQGEFVPSWRLLEEGDNSYILLTDEDNALTYAAFGNLLKITVTNLAAFRDAFVGDPTPPLFQIGMRVDNQIYVSPATPEQPSRTKYFLYPDGPTYPGRLLDVTNEPDLAPPAQFVIDLANPQIDPEATGVWDRDGDFVADYDDLAPDDDFIPGNNIIPNPSTIEQNETEQVFTVRNRTLSTFSWSLDATGLANFVSLDTTNTQFDLAPGGITTFKLKVDRTGVAPKVYTMSLKFNSTLTPTEAVGITVVVQ